MPSIHTGKTLTEKLGKDATFINSKSKLSKDHDGEIYSEIISTERFSCKVLISTSVLDNGVNIKDASVQNIVIFSSDQTQFLQMLGRKRILGSEPVNLYLYSSNVKEFTDKLHIVNDQIKFIYQFKNNPSLLLNQQFNSLKLMKGLIYFNQNLMPCINNLAKKKLYNLKLFYEEAIRDFQLMGKEAFIKKQLKWLNLEKSYSSTLWLNYLDNDKNKKEFITFLDFHCNTDLSGEALENFQKEFTRLFKASYGKQPGDRSDRVYKETKMRRVLNLYKLNYEIKIKENIFTLYKK